MTKPLGYYVSAPSGTTNADILGEIETLYGSHLERLTDTQKSALLIVLMANAVKPEGVYVDYYGDNIPNLQHLLDLSDEAKLCLCNALVNHLLLYKSQP